MSAASLQGLRNGAILILVLFAAWQLLYWVVGDVALRSPAQTVAYTAGLLTSGSFWPHLTETAKAFAAALALSVAIGLAIGFTLGLSRFAGEVFEPMLVTAYSIPKITLYPILLLMFGLGISAKIAFGTIHGFIPIALFTISAVQNIRPVFVKSGRVMGLNTFEMITRVFLPAAMPEIFSGLRIGFSLTLIGTLLGEMFASQRGIGYLLMNAIGLHNIDLIMALTFLITLFAGFASILLLVVDRRIAQT
jgi:NitT/TauT family transport system permease protein